MAPSKASSKKQQKQQKRGVDFKKIKRKIGRKLPPPKNATNTEIKSKAIILPEQTVASEKAGLAVNKKGLTLKELLQQTSHYNAKVRKDALMGIKDLLVKYPAELTLHKHAVIEKLRERIGDDDKVVRETLYQLFKSVIFPGCKEDNQGIFISLLMAYIFNAMTHLAVEVRLMSFKFFDLVAQHYPHSFFLHAGKILQNYADILQKNRFYLQDKGKLKVALSGLVRCLSMLPCNKREVNSSEKEKAGQTLLHAFEPDLPTEFVGDSAITFKLKDLVPVLLNSFQEFVPVVQAASFDAHSFDCVLYLLQSIELSVRFYIYITGEGKFKSCSSHGGLDVKVCTETIFTILFKKLIAVFPLNPAQQFSEKGDDRYFTLNTAIAEILLQLSEWISPSAISLERLVEFIESALLGKICSGTRSGRAVFEKNVVSLLPFIPKLVSQVASDWNHRLLQAFTKTFKDCSPESSLKLVCLSTIEKMIIPRGDMLCLDARIPEILEHQIAWIRELPLLLILLGDKHPSSSQAVLHLQLKLGQCALMNPSLALEYDNLQYSLQEFYGTHQDDGNICYGPFVRLPNNSQEFVLCSLYYLSYLDPLLLKSISYCCLCPDLEPSTLFRIIEVLHSAYKAGRIQIADHISFFITLLSRFRVFPDNIFPVTENDGKTSNRGTFKSITSMVCSYMSQMGDNSLAFCTIENILLDQISARPPLDNVCAMLRMLVTLDSKPTKLHQQSIASLGNLLPGYLIDIDRFVPKEEDGNSIYSRTQLYYLMPCFLLFDRSHKLLNLVLKTLGSLITTSSSSPSCNVHNQFAPDPSKTIDAIVSVLVLIHKDDKIRKIMSSFKEDVDSILQNIIPLESSEEIRMTLEEKHKIKCAVDQLKAVLSTFKSLSRTI